MLSPHTMEKLYRCRIDKTCTLVCILVARKPISIDVVVCL
jgi:hypothetical protein